MKRYNGGTKVKGGYYWNLKTWEVRAVQGAHGTLPGGEGDKFVHVALPVLFVVAPVMGGAFALFLPFIGFAMTFYGLGKRVMKAVAEEPGKLERQHH
jgi:hypothetical protein